MARMVVPNLPVRDVAAARAFWTGLGFAFDERFGSADAACLVITERDSVMLLRADFFHGLHGTRTHTGTEMLLSLTTGGRDEVDRLCARAEARGAEVGGRVDEPPMYGGSFRDPDGHLWEVLWMDTD